METIIFIYSKDNKIKAYGITDAERNEQRLLKEGWQHTATLDTCVWLENLVNNCEDVDYKDEIESLKKV